MSFYIEFDRATTSSPKHKESIIHNKKSKYADATFQTKKDGYGKITPCIKYNSIGGADDLNIILSSDPNYIKNVKNTIASSSSKKTSNNTS